jgi:hypothetical protein
MSLSFVEHIGTIIPVKWRPDYVGGRLAKALSFLEKRGVKKDDFLKSGSTCIVWNHQARGVIKLCTKRIRYFKAFPTQSVTSFKDLINNQFCSMLLPIQEVLYEDTNYFIYTQEKIKILDLSEIDVYVFSKILEIVKQMFALNILTCDLISSNFGWGSDKKLYLLDYHDMKPATSFFKKCQWSKIVRCLLEYTSYLLHKKGFEAYTGESILEWKSEMVIVKKNFGQNYFQKHFIALFKALASNDTNHIVARITDCQRVINGGISDNSETSVIMVPQASKHLHIAPKIKKEKKKTITDKVRETKKSKEHKKIKDKTKENKEPKKSKDKVKEKKKSKDKAKEKKKY